jgi:PTH1 family peptidyl-tRNA hydrolase
MKLVVGLGNPGGEYRNTRHNVGFIFLDSYLEKKHLELSKKKFNGLYIDYTSDKGEKVIFLEPQTYMNLSGDSVIDFMRYFKISGKDVLVIHDDLDLEVSKIKIRSKGGSAGHNGIKSLIARIGSENFRRVRVGIGKDKNIPVVDYVLGKFSEEDKLLLKEKENIINKVIDDFINGVDFHVIESRYN